MLIKTVVQPAFEGAKTYESYCRTIGTEKFQCTTLSLAETEYDQAFVDALSQQIAQYAIHTVFTFDYESSSDAGDGRDDYYTEEEDVPIDLQACIIKDGQFYGVMCESFGVERFVLVNLPEAIIGHPKNYGGTNYHFYRTKQFSLIKKSNA